MSKTAVLAAAAALAPLALALAAPASAAACLDLVEQVEQRVAALENAGGQLPQDQEVVEMEMEGGREVEMTVEDIEEGGEPQESWFGSPPSIGEARDQLDNAREMAELGDEEGCLEHVEQARQILDGLQD